MPVIDLEGLPMAYRLTGSGTPLVLVAGTGYPGATWHPALVDALAGRHAVLTFDHRATGDTPAMDERLSTRVFAQDAVRLMDALGLAPAHVVGHSMGGRVAQWMALDRPERVRSLVLAATGTGRGNRGGIPLHTAVHMIEVGYERYMAEHIADTFFTPEFVASDPDRVAWLVDAFWSHRPSLEGYLRHVVARQEHLTEDRLADLITPSLVLVGERDTHMGGGGSHWEQSRRLVAGLPNATFRSIPDVSHGYFWQVPGLSAEILLDWTASH
jgi:pimeloyl-ACP methyl ester carboxylesterase